MLKKRIRKIESSWSKTWGLVRNFLMFTNRAAYLYADCSAPVEGEIDNAGEKGEISWNDGLEWVRKKGI